MILPQTIGLAQETEMR